MKKTKHKCPGYDIDQPATEGVDGRVIMDSHPFPNKTSECPGSGISVIKNPTFMQDIFNRLSLN